MIILKQSIKNTIKSQRNDKQFFSKLNIDCLLHRQVQYDDFDNLPKNIRKQLVRPAIGTSFINLKKAGY